MTMTNGSTTQTMTGGEAIARLLASAGTGPLFGMAGFQLLPFYEGARANGLQHYLINDERVGAMAADAYARVANRTGLCDGTLGPGVTNLVTGLVESLNAGVPVIALAGDANRMHAGKNMTQEARQVEILRPACKELIRIEAAERIPELVRRAFAIATSGRPGPVVLDIPEDVAHATVSFSPAQLTLDHAIAAIPAMRTRPDREATARAAALLAKAKRPLILAGGGIHLSQAHAALRRIVDRFGIPVAHTMSGKGAIPCTDPLSAGLFGRYDRIANDLIAQSDALLVVGCKLGEIATKRYTVPPAGIPIVHLDIVAEEIGRTMPFTIGLWGDAAAGLDDITEAMASAGATLDAERRAYGNEVAEKMRTWREGARERYESTDVPINMGRFIGEIRKALPDDGILVADGGFAAHWTALLFDTRIAGRTYVADRGLASIGYGLPGAIGCALAAPGKPVVALTGDGGFNATLGDLETAKRVGANVTIAIVNNAASGYIKALQHAMYGTGNYQSSDLHELDYAAIARTMGCGGIRVEDPAQLFDAFSQAFAQDGPTVVDVVVTRDPGKMLPAVDSRTLTVKAGDRPV